MTHDPGKDPLLEWNRLARENTENAMVSSMFEAVGRASDPLEKFSAWLLVGAAAVASFLIANSDKMIPLLSAKGFSICGAFLYLSCTFGLASKMFALRVTIVIEAGAAIRRTFAAHLAKYEAEELKINESAKFRPPVSCHPIHKWQDLPRRRPAGGARLRVVAAFGHNNGERGPAKRFEGVDEVHPNLTASELADHRVAAVHYPELAEPIAAGGTFDLVVTALPTRPTSRETGRRWCSIPAGSRVGSRGAGRWRSSISRRWKPRSSAWVTAHLGADPQRVNVAAALQARISSMKKIVS